MFTNEQVEMLKRKINESKKDIINNENIVGYDYAEGNSDAYDCVLAMIQSLENGNILTPYNEKV